MYVPWRPSNQAKLCGYQNITGDGVIFKQQQHWLGRTLYVMSKFIDCLENSTWDTGATLGTGVVKHMFIMYVSIYSF